MPDSEITSLRYLPMSKYTSGKNTRKTRLRVYKINKKFKFVYTDRAFQHEIMAKSPKEAAFSGRLYDYGK